MVSVLITGGSGFLGRGLVRRLLDEGAERICIYSRGEHTQSLMRSDFNDDERLRWFIGDVRDVARLERAMHGVESVIHAAALKRIEVGAYNPEEMVKTNVAGTVNVIDAARRAGVARALLISSDKAYQPVSPYGQTKAIAEALFLTSNYGETKYAFCRYGNVAGSTGSVIPTWRLANGTATITSPDCTRFWMRRDEAVSLVLDTLRTMKGAEFVIPTLPAFRLGDLAIAMDILPLEVGLQPHEKLHESMADGVSSDCARRMTVEELREALAHV